MFFGYIYVLYVLTNLTFNLDIDSLTGFSGADALALCVYVTGINIVIYRE